VRNLLHNAVEAANAAPSRQPVIVRLRELDGGELELVVADRGPGVSPEVRERLFQPFATGRAEGVGLGLALTHRIVTLHGGRLVLRDRAGGGTEAVLSLPKSTVA
jgi:signal transduction histidine kinase